MAQRILGVDLGAHTVKVAELEVGFRQLRVRSMHALPLLEAIGEGEDHVDRAARTLRALVDRLERPPDVVALALGEEATLRLLELPFQDARKIDQVTGFELESQILGELEGLVVDQVIAEPHGAGARVIAVGADRERLRELLTTLAAERTEPRSVGAAVLAYAAFSERALPAREVPAVPMEPPERQVDAVIDLGHRVTRVALVEHGRTLFARAFERGGADLTTAIAEAYRVDEQAAERAKTTQAALLAAPEGTVDPQRRRLDAVLREALRPIVRELRQTFAAARGQCGVAASRLALLGGTARLPGLAEHLSAELALPLTRVELSPELASPDVTGELAGPGVPAVALGVALAAALGGGTQVNLRKGDLAFRSDYAYLRGKARYLVAAVVALLMCVTINALSSLRALRKESDVLSAKLKRETLDLFGAAELDGRAVSAELRRGPQSGVPPVPTLSAFDVLDEISRHVPAKDQIKLDILELDIKPKKTYLKATAASAKEIDALVEGLKQIDCFNEIQKGKVSTVAGPGLDKDKVELKQFTLTIETSCP